MGKACKIRCLHCGRCLSSTARRCRACRKPTISAIDHRFELRRRLRHGDGGLAFAAWDRVTRQEVFVRVLLPEANAAQQAELSAEADVLQHLHGEPGFPGFIFGGRIHQTGGLYLVEEYIVGTPLCKILKKAKPRDVVDALQRVCQPLTMLHQCGCVHGSLCLEHIVLSPTGQLVLIDFRQARPVGSNGCGTGKRGYRAPEQWRGGVPISEATDVFALGACLYMALTHRFPYGTRTRRKLMRATFQPKPPSECKRTIAAHIDHVVLLALEREPARRFPNMEALQAALTTEFGTTTQIDGFGYRFPSFPGRALNATVIAAVRIGERLQAGLRGCQMALAKLARFATMKPKQATAAALAVAVPTLMVLLFTMATPTVNYSPSRNVAESLATAQKSYVENPVHVPRQSDSQALRVPLPLMETSPDDPLPSPTEFLEPFPTQSCNVQFLTWPPAYVFVDDAYVVEAPSPERFSVCTGFRKVRLVSKQGQRVDQRLTFLPGRNYVVTYNFETRRLDVEVQQ